MPKVTIGAALALIILIGACKTGGSDKATAIRCPECPAVAVSRIIDGDTFVAASGTTVRLFGVNTPERGEPCYTEATDRLRHLAGSTVRLQSDLRTVDRFGRSLYYAFTIRGESIDAKLIQEGLATAWTRDGQHRGAMVQMEQQARRDSVGCLW